MSDQMMKSVDQAKVQGFELSHNQQKYLQEYEKYKNVELKLGPCHLKNHLTIKLEIISIDPDKDQVMVKTLSSGKVNSYTQHKARKSLELDA